MPEILTKHPNIVMKILKDANINCGSGAPQKILTSCPKEQFCALPTGELCVYGTNNISNMTQLQPLEIIASSNVIIPGLAFTLMVFLLGLWAGTKYVRRRP